MKLHVAREQLNDEQVRNTIFNIHDTRGITTLYQGKPKEDTWGLLVCCLGWSKDCIQQLSAFYSFFPTLAKNDLIFLEYYLFRALDWPSRLVVGNLLPKKR